MHRGGHQRRSSLSVDCWSGRAVLFMVFWLVACGCGASHVGEPNAGQGAVAAAVSDPASQSGGQEVRPGEAVRRSAEICRPLPPPQGRVINVGPDQAGSLAEIVARAGSGDTIMLADGTYRLDGQSIWLSTPSVTLRSASGNREAVILEANYEGDSTVEINASGVTVADLTISRPRAHGIHASPRENAGISRFAIYNVVIIDPGEQAIKGNSMGSSYADQGLVACSRLILTDAGRPRVLEFNGSCYTGGVDVHRGRGWVVRDNHVEGFFCTSDISQHGIHFWTGGRDTLVERNVVVDCARGIGFGLDGGGEPRRYDDNPCSGAQGIHHYDGIIRNNFVFASRPELFASEASFDSGISLWHACGARVIHNTVVSTTRPFASFEYRWADTRIELTNNLASHNIMARDGATATSSGNVENAPLSLFVNGSGGDLHLVAGAAAAIDRGAAVQDCTEDIDGDRRDSNPDVGADERR